MLVEWKWMRKLLLQVVVVVDVLGRQCKIGSFATIEEDKLHQPFHLLDLAEFQSLLIDDESVIIVVYVKVEN